MSVTLPLELWVLVFENVDDPLVYAPTSKDLCAAAYAVYEKRYGPHPGRGGFTYEYMFSGDNVKRALFLRSKFNRCVYFAENAARYNAINCVYYCYRNIFCIGLTFNVYIGAIKGDQLDLIKNITTPQNRNRLSLWWPVHTYLCMKYDRERILNYVMPFARHCHENDIASCAAYDGNLDVLSRMRCMLSTNLLNLAVRGNKLACVRVMIENHNVKTNEDTCTIAAYRGFVDMFKYLCNPTGKVRCVVTDTVLAAARCAGQEEILTWCRRAGVYNSVLENIDPLVIERKMEFTDYVESVRDVLDKL